MSQCYRVQLKASISRTVEAEDSVSYPLELTPLLPEPEMRGILAGVLNTAGWAESAEKPGLFRSTGPAGEELVLDLETMTVTARLTRQNEVRTEVAADGSGESQTGAQRSAEVLLRVREEAAASSLEESGTRDLQRAVREALKAGGEARQLQLHGLLQQVYAEALKRKAGQLGTVMEIQESTNADGNYELVIRVET